MTIKNWKRGTHFIYGMGYFNRKSGSFIRIQNYSNLVDNPFRVVIDDITKKSFKTKLEATKFITKYMKTQ